MFPANNLKYTVLASLYSSIFILAPILSNRIVEIFGFRVVLGAVAMTLALGLLDVINNDYGIKKAKTVILASLINRAVLYGLVGLLLLLPVVRETPGYMDIVKQSFRILVAGEIAIFLSQYFIDVHIFDFFKRLFKEKWFVIRYNVSNIVSQTLSTSLFMTLAFYGATHLHVPLPSLIIGGVTLRLMMSIILTPMMRLLIAGK